MLLMKDLILRYKDYVGMSIKTLDDSLFALIALLIATTAYFMSSTWFIASVRKTEVSLHKMTRTCPD